MSSPWANIYRRALPWLLPILGVGLLAGRYDFTGDASYSWRSYLLSAYLFAVFFPTFHWLIRTYCEDRAVRRCAIAAVFVVGTLPYHWLGLDRYKYYASHPLLFEWRRVPRSASHTDWFPGAFGKLPAIPAEEWFFGLLTAAGVVLILRLTRGSGGLMPRRLALAAWLLIVLQTWMHLSLRSPYTYIPHFEQPTKADYWWLCFLFPDGKGAVNADFPQFREAEDLFLGTKGNYAPLANRVFPAYIGAQFSGFFNAYYVWLALNCCCWLGATAALYQLTAKLVSRRAALFASLLMASAQGVILYAAQPKVYVAAICGIVGIVAFFHHCFAYGRGTKKEVLAFGAVFGLFLLTYEGQPWIITLPLLGVALSARKRLTLVAVGIGVLVSQGFAWLAKLVPHLLARPALTSTERHPLDAIKELLVGVKVRKMGVLLDLSWRGYLDCLVHAFQLTLALGVAGFFFAPLKGRRRFLLLLCLPGFLTYSLFQFAESKYYIQFPRLVYSAYPAVYILGGAALATLDRGLWAKPALARTLTWGLVLINFVYLNLDTWGFPVIYYEWFYRSAGFTLSFAQGAPYVP